MENNTNKILKEIEAHQFITPKDKLGYAEEYITINKELYKYSLSNNIEDIEIAILNRTGHNLSLNKAHWKINTNLSTYVKRLMKRHHVTYSMTMIQNKKIERIIINMQANNLWFITGYDKINNSFYCWDKVEMIELINELKNELSDKDEE